MLGTKVPKLHCTWESPGELKKIKKKEIQVPALLCRPVPPSGSEVIVLGCTQMSFLKAFQVILICLICLINLNRG